ncbi:PucR family transcriptional regulator [Nocardioides euryhalodurans]|uniref:PucR family transcriptional regulator n=1 Tax=Nocardioides euryhalodurans TaxID=2518370 RepID=A0A4P7GMJ9_9ACTN|nr:PucR family transcriptional regulator [Nocardioides euryhalodurans]QBR93104.1 PucR family transcriptional regulator [Nocardioides euryhalodurans]
MTTSSASRRLDHEVLELLRGTLSDVAQHTIAAVREEVPAYGEGLGDQLAATIEQAVQMALAGFLRVASSTTDPGTPLTPTLEGAYALGRGEARAGRSADALLSAYRVGARVSWRELSATAVAAGVPAQAVASFAELVFAYIDELSAASVAGHTDELETSGRVRQRYLDQVAAGLLRGESPESLAPDVERADWKPPRTLTAVLLPEAQVRPVLGLVPSGALVPSEHGLPEEGLAAVLVPDMEGRSRTRLLRVLTDRHAVVGPARPWPEVRASFDRAVRALPLRRTASTVDTDQNLPALVVNADPEALADLRAVALAPLADVRPSTAEKLEATLRSWLLHQGRREDVAADLFVHPQTVRYRMNQLRELYGDRLEDPDTVLALTLALA